MAETGAVGFDMHDLTIGMACGGRCEKVLDSFFISGEMCLFLRCARSHDWDELVLYYEINPFSEPPPTLPPIPHHEKCKGGQLLLFSCF